MKIRASSGILSVLSFLSLAAGVVPGGSCARFRIEELKPHRIAAVKIVPRPQANTEGLIEARLKGGVPYNFPVKPVSDGSRVYIADPENRLVRVFSSGSGELLQIISGGDGKVPEDVKFIRVPDGVPGWIAPDAGRGVYLQLHIRAETDKKPAAPKREKPGKKGNEPVPAENRIPGIFSVQDRNIVSSFIYYISSKDRMEGVIGRDGPAEKPFELIYSMDVGPENLLYVVHAVNSEKVLSVYRGGTLHKRYSQLWTVTEEEAKKHFIETEKIMPNPNGKFIFSSAVFRDKNTYKPLYRRIYRLEVGTKKPIQIYRTDEPNDFFVWGGLDGGFYLMNTREDGSGALFKIFDKLGVYQNNRLIRFPGMRASWRETYLGIDGRIFSSRLYRGFLELYEWK